MRFHELSEGIQVIDEQNKPIGVSQIAAKKVSFIKNINFMLWLLYLGLNRDGNDTCLSTRAYTLYTAYYYVGIWKVGSKNFCVIQLKPLFFMQKYTSSFSTFKHAVEYACMYLFIWLGITNVNSFIPTESQSKYYKFLLSVYP